MSDRECILGSQISMQMNLNNITIIKKEPSDCTSSSSSNGSASIIAISNSYSSSSMDSCSLSPPLKLPSAESKLSSASKVPSPDNKPLSSPLQLHTTAQRHSSPSPGYPRRAEANGAVKKSMGLMKLRRQGSHPPASLSRSSSGRASKSCINGSLNKAAAARELMASLERLSLREKREEEEDVEREALKSLLRESRATRRGSKKLELPLTAKIAAAMDAEGLIGVQKEISRPGAAFHSGMPTIDFSGGRGMVSARPAGFSRRRNRWIILRRLRSSRILLGKFWRNIKRVFSSTSKKRVHKDLLMAKK